MRPLPLGRHVGRLTQLLPLDLDVEECRLDLDLLPVLGRLLHRPVILELLKIILDSLQGVAEVSPLHQLCFVSDPNEELGAVHLVVVLLLLHPLHLHHDVANPLPARGSRLHFGEGVIVRGHVGHHGLLVRFGHVNVLSVKELRNSKVFLGNVECIFKIAKMIILVQTVELNQVWSVAAINQSV